MPKSRQPRPPEYLGFPGVDVSTLRAGVEFDVHAFARDYFPRYGAHEVEQALEDAGIEDYSVDPIEIADEISDVLVLNRKEMF